MILAPKTHDGNLKEGIKVIAKAGNRCFFLLFKSY